MCLIVITYINRSNQIALKTKNHSLSDQLNFSQREAKTYADMLSQILNTGVAVPKNVNIEAYM